MDKDALRREFEKWLGFPARRTRAGGIYHDVEIHGEWLAFRAGYELGVRECAAQLDAVLSEPGRCPRCDSDRRDRMWPGCRSFAHDEWHDAGAK